MNLYTLRDKQSNTVAPPFAAPTDGIACRYVVESMKDRDSMPAKYPGDFELFFVGEYHEVDGILLPAMPPRSVVQVKTLAEANLGKQTVMPLG